MDGPCSIVDGTSCAVSPGYPGNYGDNEECTIHNVPPSPLKVVTFAVEYCTGCACDYMSIDGVRYCGYKDMSWKEYTPPDGLIAGNRTINWYTDSSDTTRGWKVCWGN